VISARPESLIEVTGTALSAELLLDLVDDQHALKEARVLAVGPFELTLRMATQEVDVSRLEVELRCRPKSPAPQRVHRHLRSRQTGLGDRVVYLPLERALGRRGGHLRNRSKRCMVTSGNGTVRFPAGVLASRTITTGNASSSSVVSSENKSSRRRPVAARTRKASFVVPSSCSTTAFSSTSLRPRLYSRLRLHQGLVERVAGWELVVDHPAPERLQLSLELSDRRPGPRAIFQGGAGELDCDRLVDVLHELDLHRVREQLESVLSVVESTLVHRLKPIVRREHVRKRVLLISAYTSSGLATVSKNAPVASRASGRVLRYLRKRTRLVDGAKTWRWVLPWAGLIP
jgi:hypothetical protein